ncbi:MAG: 4Fe-4S binding protein [Acidilobaceae archaeon]
MGSLIAVGVSLRGAIEVSGFEELREKSPSLEPPVVVVSEKAFSRAGEVRALLEDLGVYEALVDLVDASIEPRLSRGVFTLEDLAEARLAKISESRWREARRALEPEKVVSRRSILTRGPYAAQVLLDKPVVNATLCSSLERCSLCVSRCPSRALSGKPPEVDDGKCVSCGVCYSVCPLEAISSPLLTWRSVREFCESLRKRSLEPAHVVIASYRDLAEADSIEAEHPTVLLPVESARALTPIHVAILASYGFTPHVVYKSPPLWLKEVEEAGLVSGYKSVSELREGLFREPRFKFASVNRDPTRSRAFSRLVLSQRGAELSLSFPLTSEIFVNEELCTLCGACVNSCHTGALSLAEDERSASLVFEPELCIGCRECEAVCPERAARVEWLYKPDSARRTLASSPLARCVKCGALLGPEKLVENVEKRLRRTGVEARYLRMCVICRQRSVFGD